MANQIVKACSHIPIEIAKRQFKKIWPDVSNDSCKNLIIGIIQRGSNITDVGHNCRKFVF
jgi:hypothetical protein